MAYRRNTIRDSVDHWREEAQKMKIEDPEMGAMYPWHASLLFEAAQMTEQLLRELEKYEGGE